MSWNDLPGHYNYWVAVVLMMTGFAIVILRGNLIKKIVGLNIFQTSVILFYVTLGKIDGSTAPILVSGALETPPSAASQAVIYTNPLPSVLMLTAIVVGIATTAVGLALVVRIREDWGTIEEDELVDLAEKEHAREDRLTQQAFAAASLAESSGSGKQHDH